MAELETRNPDHPKTIVRLRPGETIGLCRCFGSKKFPECDGTHRQIPGRGPAIVQVVLESESQGQDMRPSTTA
jgi:CDGSH-type Zn-finger protein